MYLFSISFRNKNTTIRMLHSLKKKKCDGCYTDIWVKNDGGSGCFPGWNTWRCISCPLFQSNSGKETTIKNQQSIKTRTPHSTNGCTKSLSVSSNSIDLSECPRDSGDLFGFDVEIEVKIGSNLYSIITAYGRAVLEIPFRIGIPEFDNNICSDVAQSCLSTLKASFKTAMDLVFYIGIKVDFGDLGDIVTSLYDGGSQAISDTDFPGTETKIGSYEILPETSLGCTKLNSNNGLSLLDTYFKSICCTDSPTNDPTEIPTNVPTISPTDQPSAAPTSIPTKMPTVEPTVEPTIEPTMSPTMEPIVPTPPNSRDGVNGLGSESGANVSVADGAISSKYIWIIITIILAIIIGVFLFVYYHKYHKKKNKETVTKREMDLAEAGSDAVADIEGTVGLTSDAKRGNDPVYAQEIYHKYVKQIGYAPKDPKHLMTFSSKFGDKLKYVEAKKIIMDNEPALPTNGDTNAEDNRSEA